MDNKKFHKRGRLTNQWGKMAVTTMSENIETKKVPNNQNAYNGISITDTVVNGFFTVDREWTVKYWNKAAEKLLGVKSEDIVGTNIWEKFAGIIPLDFYAVYHKAFQTEKPVHFEEYWGEMGSWFDVITYSYDNLLSVSFKSSNESVHPEFTKRPEKQLQIISQLYRFITEVTNDCLWEWYMPNREVFWIDGGHKRVFGYDIENALISQSFWENCIHPDDKQRVLKGLNKLISEGAGSLWQDEYRFKKANGEYAYVTDRGHIIYDASNVAIRMIGATQDITARKLTEIKLLQSEKELSLIARQSLNAVVVTDAEEQIIWVNGAFTQITGYELNEVVNKKPENFLYGIETDPETIQYLKKMMLEKKPFDCNLINYNKSGQKYWVHVQGQALVDENGVHDRYFSVQTDITDRILLENELAEERITKQREITDAVLTAQENERTDIGKELHDNLNQILAVTKMYIQLAQKSDKNRDLYLDKSRGFIMDVIDQIRRISKKLVVPGVEIIGLFDNITILKRDLNEAGSVKVEFKHSGIKDDDLEEKMQLTIFRIVQEQMNNILSHANATHALIELSRDDDDLKLRISDDGQGCNPETASKGVGIINIKSRATLYQGEVSINSSPGQGFELNVVLKLGTDKYGGSQLSDYAD